MSEKYLRILTILGLLAVIAVQGLWLVNTYRIIEGQIAQSAARKFPQAVVDEAVLRIDSLRSLTDEHYELEAKTNMKNDSLDAQAIVQFLAIFFNHYCDSVYHESVSFPRLDSLFTAALAEEGYQAEVVSRKVDAAGRILSSGGAEGGGILAPTIRTPKVFLNQERTEAVEAVIVNPYGVIFREMAILLLATVVLILFIAYCIVYQIRIILRQSKIARIRQDFTYAMIHDMKTPIGTISMVGNALESGRLEALPDLKKQYFAILNEETEHLQNLSEKILTIAKLEQARLKLVMNRVPLRSMLEELAAKYRVKSQKSAEFIVDCPDDITLSTDKEFLQEAISNLIDNSLKYSGEQVTIRLSVEEKMGYVSLKVWDNGWGIPLKEQKRIFEKFQRGSMSRKGVGKVAGFGLGLNYVSRVVSAMGGTVSVNSIEGQYSEFIIKLPQK